MQVNIKIDDELYRKLKENAKQNSRTITAQLGVILSNALERRGETNEKLNRNNIDNDVREKQERPHRSSIVSYDNNVGEDVKENMEDYNEW